MIEMNGPAVGYVDLADYAQSLEEDGFNAFPLRPSSANKCKRALTYETVEYLGLGGPFSKEVKEPNVKRLLALGHSIEWHAIKWLDSIPKSSEDFKIRFKQQSLILFKLPGWNEKARERIIEGSIDLAIMREGHGGGFLDIKSAKDKFHVAFKTNWDASLDKFEEMKNIQKVSHQAFWVADLSAFLTELDDHFFASNFLQLNIYCNSDFAKVHGIDHGAIIRYNKNDSRYLEIRFKPDAGLAKIFEQRCNEIYERAAIDGLAGLAELRCEFAPGTVQHAFCACHAYAGENPKDALNAYFATFPKMHWPEDAKADLKDDLEKYISLEKQQEEKDKLELQICAKLLDKKITKVRLDSNHIYELKQYKTGGIKNGPRVAIKRSKLK